MPTNNTSNDYQLWFGGAGGGEALVYVSGDAGLGGGNTAIALTYILQGDPNLFAPRDIMLDTVHDRFFFVDSDVSGGHNRIIQGSISQVLANPGSPALTVLYQDTGTTANASLRALHLDPENSLIYFDHGTTFNKISYDTALQTPTVLANLGSNNFITQIAIDFATGEVFLASSRVQSFFGQDIVEDNFIYRAAGLTPSSVSLTFAKLPFSPNDTAFGDPDVPPVPGNAFPQELGVIRGLDYDPVTHTLYISTASVALDTSTDQDGSEITTYYGGVFSYSTTGNPSGAYTTIYQQDGVTGPVGLLGFIEVDPSTGRYFVVDTTGGPAAGDGGVYVGSLSGGTPTLFATIGNPGNLVPQGIDILHAPTLAGTETGATTTETAGVGSGFSNQVQPFASISAGDLDSAAFTDQLAGAEVRISAGFNSAPGSNERLTIGGTTSGTLGSGISYSYNNLTGVMTLTGINSFDNYEAALQMVSYSIDGDNPDANGAAPTRTISFSVHDGLLVSDEFDTIVNVVGTDDAPVNTTGGAVATSEDAASVAVTGLSVSDVDNSSLTVTLSVGRGTLAIDTGVPGGVTAGQVTGNGTATVTLSGTQAEINTTLAAATGVSYTPTPNVNGPDTLTMTSDDGTLQDVDLVPIGVTAINDAPNVAGDGTESAATINEDMPSPVGQSVSSLFGGQYSDATDQVSGGSSADSFAGVAVTANGSNPASGQWQYFNGAIWVDIGPASDAAAVLISAATSIRFNPAANFNGAAPTLTVHLVDASGGALTDGSVVDASVTGGTTRYSTGTVVLDQNVTAQPDDPVNTVPGAVATSEDGSVVVSGLSVSDGDSPSLTVTLAVGRGTLSIDTGVAGGVTAGQVTGNGTGSVTLSGTQSEINTTLASAAGVTYVPTPNVNGPDTLTMTSDDGSTQDTDLVPIGVAAVNDAPTVAGDGTEEAATIQEDMPSPAGETVSSLFAGQYSDATDQVAGGSSANAFAGVAVTANGSNPAAGQWQYFNGAIWVDIGPASDGSAVLLAASTAIRFNPALDFTGAAPTLTVHLVDDSGGALTSGATANLSVTGGTTAYSTGTVVLSQEVDGQNDPPTGVTGDLSAPEDANNGTAAGTVVGQDPDSTSFTYTLLDDAGGRFAMDSAGNVTVADGLLLDYEQASSHTIRVRVTDDDGASSDFDMNVSVIDVLGEDVVGDGRDNTFWGGAENDSLRGGDGNDTLRGGGGQDMLVGDAGNDVLFGDGGDDNLAGGDGNDILNGGAGVDVLRGNGGEDVFVFHKGEADGDTIIDFWGQGAAIEDSIVLEGYAAGTTLTRIGSGNSVIFEINDHGFIEIITIHRTGQVHTTDWGVVP